MNALQSLLDEGRPIYARLTETLLSCRHSFDDYMKINELQPFFHFRVFINHLRGTANRIRKDDTSFLAFAGPLVRDGNEFWVMTCGSVIYISPLHVHFHYLVLLLSSR